MSYFKNNDDRLVFLSQLLEFINSPFGQTLKNKFTSEKSEMEDKLKDYFQKINTPDDFQKIQDEFLQEKAKFNAFLILINLLFPDPTILKNQIQNLQKQIYNSKHDSQEQ